MYASAQKRITGEYRTPWGSVLVLSDSGTYSYSSFECYHTVLSKGNWAVESDTLRLSIDIVWLRSDSSLFGNTEWFDDRPFIIRRDKLFFTYDGVVSRSKYFKRIKTSK